MGIKHHRKPFRPKKQQDRERIAIELADITKYVLSLWQHLGFTVEDLLAYVDIKNAIMEQRYRQEFEPLPTDRPVLVTDLDGTLANFRCGMVGWLQSHGHQRVDPETSYQIDVDLDVSYPEYWRMKRDFEMAGGYRSLAAYEDAVDFVRRAQAAGVYLVAVTARPKEVGNIWYDSWLWLRQHGIVPDQLLLMDDSERVLYIESMSEAATNRERSGKPNNIILLEDHPALAGRAGRVCNVILRAHPYNLGHDKHAIMRVDDFSVLDPLKLWRW